MFCMSLLSAYPPGANIGRFRCENTSSCSLSKSFFVGIFIWRGAIRYSFLREAPHLIDWHRESQSERFRQHAPRAEETLCSDIGYVAGIKLALMAAPEQGLLTDVARVSFQSEAVIWSGNQH